MKIIILSSLLIVSSVFARHQNNGITSKTKQAIHDCRKDIVKGINISKEERKRMKECLRSKGLNMTDRPNKKVKMK